MRLHYCEVSTIYIYSTSTLTAFFRTLYTPASCTRRRTLPKTYSADDCNLVGLLHCSSRFAMQ